MEMKIINHTDPDYKLFNPDPEPGYQYEIILKRPGTKWQHLWEVEDYNELQDLWAKCVHDYREQDVKLLVLESPPQYWGKEKQYWRTRATPGK